MKIRNGFVSNSSSSSFILVGVKLNPNSLLNNPLYREQFENKIQEEQQQLNKEWEEKMNHPDFDKFKTLYESCKVNKVSVPQEVTRFFGYSFKGVFEPQKPDERSVLSEMVYEGGFKFPKGIEILPDDDVSYLGKVMSSPSSDDYLDNGSISIEQLKDYTEKLVEAGFDSKDVRVYYGTRAC